jgi:HEAT repeat protein
MAALALGEIENPLAVDALIEALDREEGLAGPVIWAFGEIGSKRAERARRTAIEESGWRSRDNDQVWAGRMRSKDFAFLSRKLRKRDCKEELRSALNELMSRDSDDRVDAAFDLGVLGMSGCQASDLAVKPLLETLRDPIPEVRAMAVWALDEINPSRWSDTHHKGDYGHSH